MNEQDDFFPELIEDTGEPENEESSGLLAYIAVLLEGIQANTQNLLACSVRAQATPGRGLPERDGLLAVSSLPLRRQQEADREVTRPIGRPARPRSSLMSPGSSGIPSDGISSETESSTPRSQQTSARRTGTATATALNGDSLAALPTLTPPSDPETQPQQSGTTASQQAIQRRREEDSAQAQSRTLSDTLKRNLAGWSGNLTDEHSKEDMGDTAGLAAGGPIWGAIKEVSDAIVSGNKDDDTSLIGVLKKTAADKMGITAAREKIEAKKTAARDAILRWAGARRADTSPEPLVESTSASPAAPEPETAQGRLRDPNGRFISATAASTENVASIVSTAGAAGAANTAASTGTAGTAGTAAGTLQGRLRDPNGRFPYGNRGRSSATMARQQLEVAQNSFALATDEANEAEKRHEELKKILQQLAANASGGGGGLLDGVMEEFPDFERDGSDRRRGRGRRSGRGGRQGLLRRTGSRIASAGRSAGGLLLRGGRAAMGGLAAAGGVLGIGGAAGAAGAAATGTAGAAATAATSSGMLGRAGSALGRTGSLVGRGLGGAIRLVPVLGQIVAAGLAVKDGIDGWNDVDTQREAFGLHEGQEATTGQKASTSLANILDMGGLVTGAAGLMGFDVATSDLAKGIYGAAGSVADFFGFGEEDKKIANPESSEKEKAKRLDNLVAMTQPFSAGRPAATTAVSALSNNNEENGLLADLTIALLSLKDKINEEIKEVVDTPSDTSILGGGSGGSGSSGGSGNTGAGSSSGGGSGIGYGGGLAGGGYTPSKSPEKKVDAIPANAEIGSVIAKHESGEDGISAVGYDKHGGTSYGTFQLSSRAGSMEGYLKDLEKQGGEATAIAQRLRASGPMNTGSRSGAFADQWKKEAAANPDFLDRTQREYLLRENYNPAMKSLKDDGLRERINGSRTLREAMFSTAVQHGPGGAPAIWNKVYREGMSEEELLSAVYKERAPRFGSSNPKIQASARSRMERENAEMQGLLAAEKQQKAAGTASAAPATATQTSENGTLPTSTAVPQNATATTAVPPNATATTVAATPAIPDSAPLAEVRQAGSQAIQKNTDAAIASRVRYNMGSKSLQSGFIDCSGLVAQQTRAMMNGVNATMGQEVYGPEAKHVLAEGANGGAAGLIEAIGRATGQELGNADLTPDKVKEGMMIGLSKGDHARGRYKQIGHVVQPYRDPETGVMMVSESTSAGRNQGKDGVRKTPYADWWKRNANTAMHGVDPALLANVEKVSQPGSVIAQPALNGATQSSTALAGATQTQNTIPPTSVSATPAETALQAESVAVQTAQPVPTPREPEAIGANPSVQQASSPGGDMSRIEQLLTELITTVRQQGTLQGERSETSGNLNIPMDFSDPYLLNIAHDRA